MNNRSSRVIHTTDAGPKSRKSGFGEEVFPETSPSKDKSENYLFGRRPTEPEHADEETFNSTAVSLCGRKN